MPFTYSILTGLTTHLIALKPVCNDNTITRNCMNSILNRLRAIYNGVYISSRYVVVFEHSDGDLERVTNVRAIFSRNKSIDPVTPTQSVFNGVVVDIINATIVSSSPRALNTQPSKAVVLEATTTADIYNIFPVIDGTVLTLYKRGAAWHISTARGVDIDATTMFGITPLLVLVTNTLTLLGINIEPFYLVSMVFTHPEWHPACTKPLINIIEIRDSNLDLVSAPLLQPYYITPLLVLPTVEAGYILRAKLDYQSTHVDYIVEGSHMSLMRRCIYSPCHDIRDLRLIALHVYLINVNRIALALACPALVPLFTQTDDRIEQLITRILSKLRSSKTVYTVTRFEVAATYFVSKLINIVQPNNPAIRSIIRDFVININHINIHEKFIL